jgi:putative SOS response-associated peptidase YedK
MCGRFALLAKADLMREFLNVVNIEDPPARYNIAPTQPVLIVVASDKHEPGSNLPGARPCWCAGASCRAG